MSKNEIHAVDLFCGVGGLSYGLLQAGVNVVAGVDLDGACEHPFEANIAAPFLKRDIRDVTGEELRRYYPKRGLKLLAGCAPCQPFSKHRRGADTSTDDKWTLLDEFARIVCELKPDLVTMENVPGLANTAMFSSFVEQLHAIGYYSAFKLCFCPDYGLPQNRRRLVLVASLLGQIEVPAGTRANRVTVRDAISHLPRLKVGGAD